jgi:hypothetical protein
METLVDCTRCGSNACLQQEFENSEKGWFCFGCGFTTSTQLVKDTEILNTVVETLPELYKDLLYVDNENKVWMPATVTLPEKGIVFLDGESIEEWGWSAAKVIQISEEEKHRFPEDQKVKVDYSNKKTFSRQDFMDALEHIEFFKQEIPEM